MRFFCLSLSIPFLLEGCLLEGLGWWSHSHRPQSWGDTTQINSQAKNHHWAVCQTPFGLVRIFSAFPSSSHSFHIQKKSAQWKKIILPYPSLWSLLCFIMFMCCVRISNTPIKSHGLPSRIPLVCLAGKTIVKGVKSTSSINSGHSTESTKQAAAPHLPRATSPSVPLPTTPPAKSPQK